MILKVFVSIRVTRMKWVGYTKCSTHGNATPTKFQSQNLKLRDHLGDQTIEGTTLNGS